MEKILRLQYDLVKDSREALLEYCDALRPAELAFEFEGFGGGSIRYLLIHGINTYRFWLGSFAQGQDPVYLKAGDVEHLKEVRLAFEQTDALVAEFFDRFKDRFDTPVSGHIRQQPVTATPLKLFTHVITHEFHHKGQILSMSRQLGYVPVDTDIIR
jgi:uncharacterized damage-inducible protein DinB